MKSTEQAINDDIEKSMSETLYVTEFADTTEELGINVGNGVDYMDVAGETPHAYRFEAAFLAGKVEHLNQGSLASMYLRAIAADDLPDTAEHRKTFGHYMVMEAVGSGVSWSDSHASFEHSVPYHDNMIAMFSQESILNNTNFSLEDLDLDDEDDIKIKEKFEDLTEKNGVNPFYQRSAVGMARGVIAVALADSVESREGQKALSVCRIVKNEEALLAGFRLLGATFEANRNVSVYKLLESPDNTDGAAYRIAPKDFETYRTITGENLGANSPDNPYAKTAWIIGGQRLQAFASHGVKYPEYPEAVIPSLHRDYSGMVESIRRQLNLEGPSPSR